MVKEGKVRFTISMSKEQEQWLSQVAKNLKISKSKAIVWLISKNCARLLDHLSDMEWKEIKRIASIPWVIKNDEE